MATIKVVNKYAHTPSSNDVYIGRGSALGNPFTSIQDRKTKAEFVCGTREESIESYRSYLADKIKAKDPSVCGALNRIYSLSRKGEVNLVCYCAPKSCHGDIIKQVVESVRPVESK